LKEFSRFSLIEFKSSVSRENTEITTSGKSWVEESLGPKSISIFPIDSAIKKKFVKNVDRRWIKEVFIEDYTKSSFCDNSSGRRFRKEIEHLNSILIPPQTTCNDLSQVI